jgi:Ras-related protein Rab-33B
MRKFICKNAHSSFYHCLIERFRRSMINHYYRNVHAIVYVYDVTNLASFENLPGWINECDKHVLDQDLPRVLVGNKCDVSANHVVVPTTVAQRFAVCLYLNSVPNT